MPGSEPGALGLLATPQWQTARESNPSDQIESLGTSPEVKRFMMAEAGSSRTPKAAVCSSHRFQDGHRRQSVCASMEVGARIERARHR